MLFLYTNADSLPNKLQELKQLIVHLYQLNIYKSPGPDSFHPRVLYELRYECEPLYSLFSISYFFGKLPADCRTANITAVHKKGNKKEPSNYRPVSLTSVICKIMESIVRDIIMENFLLNVFFSDYQYGFIKGGSTFFATTQNYR